MRKRHTKKYVFTRNWRQYRAGEAVPDALDDGTVGTMLAGKVIQEGPADGKSAAAASKSIDAPPADKSMSGPSHPAAAAVVSRKASGRGRAAGVGEAP